MLEFFELNDLASYLTFASLIVQVTATFGLFYFLQFHFKNRTQIQPTLLKSEDSITTESKCLYNVVNSFAHWLALCVRRKESPDEDPSHVLLKNKLVFTNQGGQTWKINQIKLYPLPLKDFFY
ncbi:hypothetical protein [Bacillus massiliigorillae]|uniref:hypothetical protein n=1 Tax=Bacillus massiliigorillae TaxID=1243664 RepID=UPI0005A6AE2B|nr:hypothetical protein [Bacillus massiliigorillae]